MASAFDEADALTTNILHGKNLTNTAASNLTSLEKVFREFKRETLKSAGKVNSKELDENRTKISQMFRDAKFMIDEETSQSASPNDRTLLRLRNDYEALLQKFETFCKETLSNSAFRAGTDQLDANTLSVAQESER